MTDFLRAQLPFIASLQNSLAANSSLVSFWKFITILGNEEFFLLLIPLVYWCISRRRGLQLGALVIGGDALNVLLKLLFAAPRPYWFGEEVRALSTDPSFGIPSSHAQNALAVWLFLAYVASKRYSRNRPYFFGAAILLIGLISLSRVVLGVHFPTDILGGWLFGAAWLLVFRALWSWMAQRSVRKNFSDSLGLWLGWFSLALGVLIVQQALNNKVSSDLTTAQQFWRQTNNAALETGIAAVVARSGALFGLICGTALVLRGTGFRVSGTTLQKIGRFLVGFVGILVIWRGLAAVFPKGESEIALVFRFVRYALLTLWVTWLWPLLWNRPKLKKGISPLAAVD
ncbi:MAG TPA: phosphatase PAP2 family protein [Abditibacteriaceae bacterium]